MGKGDTMAAFPDEPDTGVRLSSTGASFQPLASRLGGGGGTLLREGALEIGGGGAGTET